MADEPPGSVENQEPKPLGSGRQQLGRQSQPFECRHDIVCNHR